MQEKYFKVRPLARMHRGRIKHVAAAAAYQSRSLLFYREHRFDFRSKQADLVWDGIILPPDAPRRFTDRQTLCDAMQAATNFRDGLMARWIVASLPGHLSHEDMIDKVVHFCLAQLVTKGMCVDAAIHEPQLTVPHVHILASVHSVMRDGFGTYQQKWQLSSLHETWRKAFEM